MDRNSLRKKYKKDGLLYCAIWWEYCNTSYKILYWKTSLRAVFSLDKKNRSTPQTKEHLETTALQSSIRRRRQ